jgi:predicted small metal-binding protein
MALRIICMCGYVIQGDDDEELWKNAQGHMGILHPELVGNVTREDLLAQAEQLLAACALQQSPVDALDGGAGRDPEFLPEQDA